MAEYIEREKVFEEIDNWLDSVGTALVGKGLSYYGELLGCIEDVPAADVAPVRNGRWILEANKERVNCRWNVTAECSECCDEKKEIWGGFFPNVPDCIARDVAIISAESVELSNYCPNCGAKMNGGENDGTYRTD